MTITPADITAYRARVRGAFEPFANSAERWEREGRLPTELFVALGRADIFRDRWAHGARGGLPLARALGEELAPANGGAALAVSLHSEAFVHALQRYGRTRHGGIISSALAGDVIGCVAFTEPTGGSDLLSLRTLATAAGQRGWHLSGRKCFITNISVATHAIVLASTGSASQASTLFLVPLSDPGVRVVRLNRTLGVRSVDNGVVDFDLFLPADNVVGRPGMGLMYALNLVDYERLIAAAGLVAAARHALRLCTAHMRRRTQFGKRLLDHQAIAHRLAQQWAEVEGVAALVDALYTVDAPAGTAHHRIAAAKLLAAKACLAAVDECIQLMGGRGYLELYPFERLYRDARLARIGGGTDEIMRQIIVSQLDVPDAESEGLLARLDHNLVAHKEGNEHDESHGSCTTNDLMDGAEHSDSMRDQGNFAG
jgi:alkylation response protein AidB-like acyl-CoA dehydrogenase